jgi:hypothetical protein
VLTFDCWNTYLAGTNGTGLNAADTEYFDALSQCDLPWLILTFAAVHPPFTSKAKAKNPDYGPLYEEICGKSSRTFTYSRERCSGFNLKMHARMTSVRPYSKNGGWPPGWDWITI